MARRQWRFDFAWPVSKVAVECEGITRAGGRHQRIGGFNADLEKYAAAELAGWRVIRVGSVQIKDGTALSLIERALRWISNEDQNESARSRPADAGDPDLTAVRQSR